jgi:hypothetical protein
MKLGSNASANLSGCVTCDSRYAGVAQRLNADQYVVAGEPVSTTGVRRRATLVAKWGSFPSQASRVMPAMIGTAPYRPSPTVLPLAETAGEGGEGGGSGGSSPPRQRTFRNIPHLPFLTDQPKPAATHGRQLVWSR